MRGAVRIRRARADDWEYIERARRQTYVVLGGTDDSPWARPVPYGIHLIAISGNQRIGMAEGYLYRDAYGSLAESPFATIPQLIPIGLERLASMRTVWVEPGFRGMPAFAYLAVLMAAQGVARGATHATVSTVPTHPAVTTYRELGGEPLGTISAFGAELLVLIFNLDAMLGSGVYARARRYAEEVGEMVGGP